MIFSSTGYAEWTKVGGFEGGNTYYVDFERVRKHDGYVYFWFLSDYVKPTTEMKLMSSKMYFQGDCGVFRYKILQYVYHQESMGRDEGEMLEAVKKEWDYIQPDTFYEDVLNLVCKQSFTGMCNE